eukprot:7771226-Pyramimonas_sp.AAC.1
MRFPPPAQRFVAPEGAPPKVPVAKSACGSPTQYTALWPQRELHRRSQWRSPHAVPPPCTALR